MFISEGMTGSLAVSKAACLNSNNKDHVSTARLNTITTPKRHLYAYLALGLHDETIKVIQDMYNEEVCYSLCVSVWVGVCVRVCGCVCVCGWRCLRSIS